MVNFVNTNFPDTGLQPWRSKVPNTGARVTQNGSMRVYELENLCRGQYVFYAVPGQSAPGTFIIKGLPAGSYSYEFMDPRTGKNSL